MLSQRIVITCMVVQFTIVFLLFVCSFFVVLFTEFSLYSFLFFLLLCQGEEKVSRTHTKCMVRENKTKRELGCAYTNSECNVCPLIIQRYSLVSQPPPTPTTPPRTPYPLSTWQIYLITPLFFYQLSLIRGHTSLTVYFLPYSYIRYRLNELTSGRTDNNSLTKNRSTATDPAAEWLYTPCMGAGNNDPLWHWLGFWWLFMSSCFCIYVFETKIFHVMFWN